MTTTMTTTTRKRRHAKPKAMRLTPKSSRLIDRMAAVLAFLDLDGGNQDRYRRRAEVLIEHLARVQP